MGIYTKFLDCTLFLGSVDAPTAHKIVKLANINLSMHNWILKNIFEIVDQKENIDKGVHIRLKDNNGGSWYPFHVAISLLFICEASIGFGFEMCDQSLTYINDSFLGQIRISYDGKKYYITITEVPRTIDGDNIGIVSTNLFLDHSSLKKYKNINEFFDSFITKKYVPESQQDQEQVRELDPPALECEQQNYKINNMMTQIKNKINKNKDENTRNEALALLDEVMDQKKDVYPGKEKSNKKLGSYEINALGYYVLDFVD